MTGALAPGYVVRPPHVDDAEGVYGVMVATDVAEFGDAFESSLDELRADWGEMDLERDAWLVVGPDGAYAGYASVWAQRHVRLDVEVYVHPNHVGRGIGTELIRRTEARAREHVPLAPPGARVVLNNSVNALNAAACALLEREGYAPGRYFWRMEAELEEPPPTPVWPPDVTVRPGVPGADERTFYATFQEGMHDHWGHVPLPFEVWDRRRVERGGDLGLGLLALAGDEPVGAALCSVSEGVGWVDVLAVRRPWRRRGIGLALLRHALGEFFRRGTRRVALGVDAANPTGATRLYERAGMRVTKQYAVYGKELRPGAELADAEEDAGGAAP
jgi:GNAT superfamily N-acetyltransferase